VASIDVYRGFVMFLMLAEVLHLPQVAKLFPESRVWQSISFHTSHVVWTGCSLHDLIQPSFSFLVGVSLPFSIAARRARGQSTLMMIVHAVWRSLLLIGLGVFLRSVGKAQSNFTFEDTLSQIGLGYTFLFVLGLLPELIAGNLDGGDSSRSLKWQSVLQWAALVVVVAGYWLAFLLYPLPPVDFDYAKVSVAADWPHHATGLAAHWNKNSNLAWAFDTWFLNLFPREQPFIANRGGYATLSFIPTLGTMILGLIAGEWMRRDWTVWKRSAAYVVAGLACMALGYAAGHFGICPVVKRIWTPSWTLYSGGWCLLILALVHVVCDGVGWRAWAFPLIVIGANSIFIYAIHGLMEGFILQSFRTHFGQDVFKRAGADLEPLVAGMAVLTVFWLILFWMYRRRIFLRI
jgi:predicted acyltransferase